MKIKKDKQHILLLVLLICYILSLMLDYGISFNECSHNPNFYKQEYNKGFADICQSEYRGHWYLISVVFLEPFFAIYLFHFFCGIRNKRIKNIAFLLISFIFSYKLFTHIFGGYSWVLF